jgi:hypothetical protein
MVLAGSAAAGSPLDALHTPRREALSSFLACAGNLCKAIVGAGAYVLT